MKILFDIGHPAHVHYFKNLIYILQNNGNEIRVIARDRYPIFNLLDYYKIKYIGRERGADSVIGKLLYMLKADFFILRIAKQFKPDLLVCFGAVYLSHVAKLLSIPNVFFDDTEHAKLNHKLYAPFSTTILTPKSFQKDFGRKHIRFNGNMELCYLHPNYFTPDPSVLDLLGVKKNENYIIMRFVSWRASHDSGQSGLSLEMKRKCVKELSKFARVFISSEGELPRDLKPYQIKIPPEKMHDALCYAALYFGEGGTTATEAAILGTPNILINPLAKNIGIRHELKNKYNIHFYFDNVDEGINKSLEIFNNPGIKSIWKKRADKMLFDKIDITAFMVWFIESFPRSLVIMKKNPDYQNNFK